MQKHQVKTDDSDEAFDIPSLELLSEEDYLDYLKFELISLDHHDIIRSEIGGYPIAATSQQARILANYLQGLAEEMAAAGK
ncbi:hypothetical protein [Castellaniella ginsengisoli]|uniref:Uncharacterized protein n=1 Tax=Castellaniella ginsengisoli TaxID=546114 RepID=A0AB39D5B6_9BURK